MESDDQERIKILVVEDEFTTGCEIQGRLIDLGYDVPVVVDTGKEAIAMARKLNPRVVIMDITLKGEMSGIEAAEQIRKLLRIPVIFLTAHSDDRTVENAVAAEPFSYLIKPLEERALHTAIRMAIYKHSLEQALRESENKYRAIAELAEDPIFIINNDHSLAFMNRFGERFFHCQPTVSAGKPIRSLIDPSFIEVLLKQVEYVFSSASSVRLTLAGTNAGSSVWLDTTLVPVLSEEGTVTQVIGLLRDITAMILLEREMEKKGIKQIEQNMEQFQILNDQIRNPLAIIMGMASLEDTEKNATIIEEAKKINDLVDQLDQGWVTSECVRSFLLKQYGHGRDID